MKDRMNNGKKNNGKQKHYIRRIVLGLLVLILAGGILMAVKFRSLLTFTYPEIPAEPLIGEWYKLTPEGARSADGSEWHGLIRLGQKDKVLVYFNGGGVSFNEVTSLNSPDWFYISNVAVQDAITKAGIFEDKEENPFHDWTILMVEYASGDFHCGQGTLNLKDEKGEEKIIYHNGYNNYAGLMELAKPYLGDAKDLVVTGSSAGGFATALLTDDVMKRIPSAENVTACVDGALLYYDSWQKTARTIWQAPEEIAEKLTGDNLVLDSLKDLCSKRENKVKILFTCSQRDSELQKYQSYLDGGKMEQSKENGDHFQKNLSRMIADMKEQLPGCGFYIFNEVVDEKSGSTQHMILPLANYLEPLYEGKSVADWLMDAVNGQVTSYGL